MAVPSLPPPLLARLSYHSSLVTVFDMAAQEQLPVETSDADLMAQAGAQTTDDEGAGAGQGPKRSK